VGVAPTIDDLAKKNAAFQKYIDDQSKAMNTASTTAKADMDQLIKQFYQQGNWDDAKPFISGSYQHLTTAESWSLDNVSKMIDAIRGAVFGGSATPPAQNPANVPTKVGDGTTPPPKDLPTTEAMKAMAGMDLLIASAAFDIIQGILTTFTVSTSASIVHNVSQKELVPGLSLFVTVMENQYQSNDFFSNQVIIQNFYLFDARLSVKRAADIAKFNQVQSLITQQTSFETAVDKLSTIIAGLDVNDPHYLDNLQVKQNILETLNKRIEDLAAKIKAMRDAKNAAAAALVQRALERARA